MSHEPPESAGDRIEHKSAQPVGSVWIKVAVAAVTLFWVAMTWSLMRREIFLPRLPRPRMDSSAARITFDSLPRDTWMGIYFSDGRKVGFSHSLIEARGDRQQDGYLVTGTTHMAMAFLGNSSQIDVDTRAELSGDGSFERFFIDLKSGPASFKAEARVADGKTRFKVTTGGATRSFDVASTPDALLADSMSPLLGATHLRTGVTYRANLLDPLSFVSSPARVTRVGREPVLIGTKKVEADRIVIKYQGIETTAWIIDSGDVVRVDTAMGLSMVREPKEMARDMSSATVVTRGAPADLARFAVMPTGKRVPADKFVSAMSIRITGQPLAGLDVEDDSQRLTDPSVGALDIKAVGAPPIPKPYPFARFSRKLRKYTEPELLVEADDPAIVKKAREIVGDATDSWQASLAIYKWVYENVKKEIVFGVPSTVEVFKTRRGDCNEHTVLFVGLARAAGIPARIELGLVYSEGGFYYHAWPAVYVGRWVRMDPTLGQPVADATHIRFVEGGISRWSEVLRLVGAIQIEVDKFDVDARKSPRGTVERDEHK